MKSKLTFLLAAIGAIIAGNLQKTNAQNTWNLAGNSNATTSSKLGTTGLIPLRLFTNNNERIRITPSGQVGIGNTTPGFPLNFSTALGDKISLWGNNGGHYGFGVQSRLLQIHTDESLSDIAFGYGSSSNFTERMRIKGNGNVGIGTDNPGAKLDVTGSSIGVRGSGSSYGLYGSGGAEGVHGKGNSFGIYGDANGFGVFGMGAIGVYGFSSTGENAGVLGVSDNNYGGSFQSTNNAGIRAETTNGSYAGVFYGNVWTSGSYVGSDKNLKKNIREFENALNIINKLKPKYYEFDEDAKFTSLHLSKGSHYGLIAQEVEEVLPNLVKESKHELAIRKTEVANPVAADGKEQIAITKLAQNKEIKESMNIKGVNYTELIPILIKGIQEQQQQIEELKQMVQKLSKGQSVATNTNAESAKTNVAISSAKIEQNNPNPFTNTTSIRYNLPASVKSVQLKITDNFGKAVKQIALNAGPGVVNIDASALSSGIYNYTLLVDGKAIESKKMVVAH